MALLGLCCCTWAFSSCGKQALLLFVDSRLLYAGASFVWSTGSRSSGFSTCRMQVPVCGLWVLEHGLSIYYARALSHSTEINSFFFFFKETEIIKKGSKQGVCCWFSGWDSILSLMCLDSVLVRELRSLKLCNEAEKEKESSRNSF